MAGSGGASQYALLAEGYEVITATDAFEALNILRGAYPELLITELNLPHMSGFELLQFVSDFHRFR